MAADFHAQAVPAANFFFDKETMNKHWFFVNVLGSIIFFIAFVQMMYYLGVMQWVIVKLSVTGVCLPEKQLLILPTQCLVLLQDHERLWR